MKQKILWISDSPILNTGLARVGRETIKHLLPHYDFTYLGWFHNNLPHDYPYPIYQGFKLNFEEELKIIPALIQKLKIDILFCVGDFWYFHHISKIKSDFPNLKIIGWLTIDGEPFNSHWYPILKSFDRIIVMSIFGKLVIQDFDWKVIENLKIIYPGVDTSIFRPLDNQNELKRKFKCENKFVILFVGQNTIRKNIGALIEAFSIFTEDKDDVILYLHTNVESHNPNFDVKELTKRYGLKGKVLYTTSVSPVISLDDKILNLLYNTADVICLPTAGEGYGLSIVEAFACKKPVIATKFTSCIELISYNRGILIEPSSYIIGEENLKKAFINTKELAEAFQILYYNKEKRIEFGNNGYNFIKDYTWKKTAENLHEIIKELNKNFINYQKDLNEVWM